MGDEKPKLPYGRSYWVEPGKLMAGFFPGDSDTEAMRKKVDALIDCGVQSIVSLMMERETDFPGSNIEPYQDYFLKKTKEKGIESDWKRFPIVDMDVAGKPNICETLTHIDREIAKGRIVYVHCWAGLGRAGTIVGCWLMRHGLADSSNVLDEIKKRRVDDDACHAASPQTLEQASLVEGWEKGH